MTPILLFTTTTTIDNGFNEPLELTMLISIESQPKKIVVVVVIGVVVVVVHEVVVVIPVVDTRNIPL